jgi:hypothetical protein
MNTQDATCCWVRYHSREWADLVEQGWITMRTEDWGWDKPDRWALMLWDGRLASLHNLRWRPR